MIQNERANFISVAVAGLVFQQLCHDPKLAALCWMLLVYNTSRTKRINESRLLDLFVVFIIGANWVSRKQGRQASEIDKPLTADENGAPRTCKGRANNFTSCSTHHCSRSPNSNDNDNKMLMAQIIGQKTTAKDSGNLAESVSWQQKWQ